MKISTLIFFVLFIYSCTPNKTDTHTETIKPNTEMVEDSVSINNYIILLDLSDRLIKNTYDGTMQFQRDTALLQGILKMFESISNGNLFNCVDRLTIEIAIQEQPLYSEAQFSSDLNMDLKKSGGIDRDSKSEYLVNKLNSCSQAIIDLYRQAASSSETQDYKGADVWRYIKENLKYEIKTDEKGINYSNILIIITDGYMDFENLNDKRSINNKSNTGNFIYEVAKKKENWEEYFDKSGFGFVHIQGVPLEDVKVVVAEIAPKADYHKEI